MESFVDAVSGERTSDIVDWVRKLPTVTAETDDEMRLYLFDTLPRHRICLMHKSEGRK